MRAFTVRRRAKLLDLLPGKVAVVSIFLDESRLIAHCLAWVDKYALDPSVPAIVQPFDLHAQQIRVVHLLPEIDAGTRLSELTEQPLEGHSDHGHLTLLSTILGFLVGAATGAAGTYFGNKYTDRRKEREGATRTKKQFLAANKQMPELMAEMKADLSTDDGAARPRVLRHPAPPHRDGPLGETPVQLFCRRTR